MYRIDNATADVSLPAPQPVGPKPNAYFTRGNPSSAILATIVDDDWCNAIQEELANVIESAGITLDKTDRTQLLAAFRTFVNPLPYVASTTAANTYVATPSPALSSYVTGSVMLVKFTHGNTGAATINFNALGAQSIKRPDGTALQSGDISDGMLSLLSYDGTNYQLLNAQTIKASYIQNNQFKYAADVGGANTLSATMSPAITAYTTGLEVFIKVNTTNTGASTINLNGLGAKSIKIKGADPISNDLVAGQIIQLTYDGTNFQLMNYVNKGLPQTTVITSGSGTYTTPAGTLWLEVWGWGPGGGGGGATGGASQTSVSVGGSGGGFFYKKILNPAATYAYVVGTGGAGGFGGNGANGSAATTFGGSLTANPGTGGLLIAANSGNGISPGSQNGGTATGGDINIQGGPPGNSFLINGATANGVSGTGGVAAYGTPTQGVHAGAQGNGISGTSPGCGGSGAASSTGTPFTGGAGANGQLNIVAYVVS